MMGPSSRIIRSSASIVCASKGTPSPLDLTSWRFDGITIASKGIMMTSNPQRSAPDHTTSTSSVQGTTLDVLEKRFDLRENRLDAQEIVADVHGMRAELTFIEADFRSLRFDVNALTTDRLEEQADALTMRAETTSRSPSARGVPSDASTFTAAAAAISSAVH